MDSIHISQKLVKAAKTKANTTDLVKQLQELPFSQLSTSLITDAQKKAFWINVYNAFVIILLQPQPTIILNPWKRKLFFNRKKINIAGQSLSLNNIEHHFLRKSKVWWTKGYLNRFYALPIEQHFRVNVLDPRIHFALNCGALGCPPIRYYDPKHIEEQLEVATQAFLFSEVKKEGDVLYISQLFNWYIADFGGKKGLIEWLKKQNMIPNNKSNTIIKYLNYDWHPWVK